MKDRIEQVRNHYGMIQSEFAKAIGISAPSLSSIINGRTSPTNNTVQAIHRRFPEISITWLMFGEGDMETTPEKDDSQAQAQTRQDEGVRLTDTATKPSGNQLTLPHTPADKVLEAPVTVREIVKYVDKPQRHITEIHVFYDDGTFETFSARKD
jgi:transcriptional regulator with XRE-family HTH domain